MFQRAFTARGKGRSAIQFSWCFNHWTVSKISQAFRLVSLMGGDSLRFQCLAGPWDGLLPPFLARSHLYRDNFLVVREGVFLLLWYRSNLYAVDFQVKLGGPDNSSVLSVGSLYSRMVERLLLSPLVSYWGIRFLPPDVVWCSSGSRSSLRMAVSLTASTSFRSSLLTWQIWGGVRKLAKLCEGGAHIVFEVVGLRFGFFNDSVLWLRDSLRRWLCIDG